MRSRFAVLMTLALAIAGLFGASGCDEIGARRQIQQGNEQFENGRYEAARDLYEAALKKAPHLDIGHHNLGVTYYKLMKRGDKSPENQAIANRATEHLLHYLSKHPKEELIRKLVTDIWVDSGQVERALAFWEEEHRQAPDNRSIHEQLADLNYKNGDWRKAIEWLERSVAAAPDQDAKAASYLSIGRLAFSKLFNNKDTIVGAERIEIADTGIAALQKGLAIQPKNGEIVSTLASLNQQRAIAQGSRIGFHLDDVHRQNYLRVLNVLKEEAKKQAPPPAPGDGAAAPADPAAPAQGT